MSFYHPYQVAELSQEEFKFNLDSDLTLISISGLESYSDLNFIQSIYSVIFKFVIGFGFEIGFGFIFGIVFKFKLDLD